MLRYISRSIAAGTGWGLIALAFMASSTLVFMASSTMVAAAEDKKLSISSFTAGMRSHDGIIPFYTDPQTGKLWIKLSPAEGEPDLIGSYIYYEGLLTGLGSNPVGLDRGQLGRAKIIDLRRVGGRLLIQEQNLRYRAVSEDPAEARAVQESFATSILWAGEIHITEDDGTMLVDLSSFLVRDAHDVVQSLKDSDQGSYSLDAARSVIDLDACLGFPKNVELEAVLTYSGAEPGEHVRETAPHPQAITLVQHHSFLALPDDGYKTRRFDPRIGSFHIEFSDYAAPLGGELRTRWVERHRLEKSDPSADRSAVKEPIIYYVDRGVPEPIRSALIDGASWWAEAFEAAGFIDAYRVEVLPEDAHPLDARYNVIQWVHRSTRGWSYGGGVVDPRTGEIIKGHVSLGSLRVRQDRLLFEGLAGTSATGSGSPDDPVQLALARIRQLSAHEVGHTLGLSHNFAASTYADRASVMDYPAPLVRIDENDNFDFSSAYGVGVGVWDRHVIRYLYSEYSDLAQEQAGLSEIIQSGIDNEYRYLSDRDARSSGAANPLGNLWDNGSDPVAELLHVLRVRELALKRFDESAIAVGVPLANTRLVLAPVYFQHRYQLAATAKMVGGTDYSYSVRGDGQRGVRIIGSERQREALAAILGILSVESLGISNALVDLLAPFPPGYSAGRERFRSQTSPVFDRLGAVATASEMVVTQLLQPERAARLVDFHARDEENPGLGEVLSGLSNQAFANSRNQSVSDAAIQTVIQQVTIREMISLAENSEASASVRAQTDQELERVRERLLQWRPALAEERANRDYLLAGIGRHLERSGEPGPLAPPALEPPPGSPIGSRNEPGSPGQFRLEECSFSSP